MDNSILPGLPADLIRAAYEAAPGNELLSGKFNSLESSAALVANTFGLFLDRPGELPPLPGTEQHGWPALGLQIEAIVRFPWSGGRHPCLDVLVETQTALIGIESKRYEPLRPKRESDLSKAYWRPVWGEAMDGYERIRDGVADGSMVFTRLDVAQLVKHAFGLRTAVHRETRFQGKTPILLYLHAEPRSWPDGRTIPQADIEAHRIEVSRFAGMVAGDEVLFRSCSYAELLSLWDRDPKADVRAHAAAIRSRFSP